MLIRQRHNLRIDAASKGKSNMSAATEQAYMDQLGLDAVFKNVEKAMHLEGQGCGEIWDWLNGIRGISGNLAAKLLALIDYPAPFPGSHPEHCATISKLRAYAGYGLHDGEIDRPKSGNKLPYNKQLKSVCFQIGDQFIRQQTPPYVDAYYAEKERQRRLHPAPVCNKCGGEGIQKGQSWRCGECGQKAGVNGRGWGLNYTPMHVHRMAMRKMIKIFLSHVWLKWREFEGLPLTKSYEEAILGHTNIIEPPN